MNKRNLYPVIGVLSAVMLIGCSNMSERETTGSVIGGVAGAVIGSQIGAGSGQIIATAAGTLLGALTGHYIGKEMDDKDNSYAAKAYTHATNNKIGEKVHWNNDKNGHSGYVMPVRDGMSSSGYYCRELEMVFYDGYRRDKMYGTACKMPDGTWRAA